MPESFKVLIKELQSIGLDIKVLSEDAQEIVIKDDEEDINETARELDLDVTGVDPTQRRASDTGAQADGAYDENDAADESPLDNDNIIADLGDSEMQDEGPDDFPGDSADE